jgi:transposase InsO family protein
VSAEDLVLMRRIDELHLEYPFAGSRMLRDFLNREGVEIGRRHVTTLMKRMGVEAIYRRPNTSKPALGNKIYPYLLRGLKVDRPPARAQPSRVDHDGSGADSSFKEQQCSGMSAHAPGAAGQRTSIEVAFAPMSGRWCLDIGGRKWGSHFCVTEPGRKKIARHLAEAQLPFIGRHPSAAVTDFLGFALTFGEINEDVR